MTIFLLNGILVVLNVAEQSQALVDLLCCVILLYLNCLLVSKILLNSILVVLNVAELSQALHDLYTK